ncbi:hypothetical protein QBC44DRAFT_229097 [Cladorrhinum sp. PSN332]|nr:hypothetical protein QBC44DRAFT_229097 [Cladorrhinum sp. PSN332]
MATSDSNVVDLPASLRKRFYEPVVFLYSFRSLLKKQPDGTKPPDLETTSDSSPKATFFCFVNKLALVCHSKKGRDTITAFAVLQTGPIEYRFASNQRSAQELDDVGRYVTTLLETLGKAEDSEVRDAALREDSTLFSAVMKQILEFNRAHIVETHINYQFDTNVDFCIKACNEAGQKDGSLDIIMGNVLESLKSLAQRSLEPYLDDAQFAERTRQLLRAVSRCYRNDSFKQYMSSQTREDREGAQGTPWTQVYHGIGRLQAYTLAVKTFLKARTLWRQLFEDFEVTPVPSSEPGDPPSIRRSSAGIISRLSTDPAVLGAFRTSQQTTGSQASDLIAELDKEINKATKRRKFEPIIHAEVLLSDNILREEQNSAIVGVGTGDRLRFFKEADFGRYVGCSKPSCRLCELYFQAPVATTGRNSMTETNKIQVRPGHQNFYHAWRAPDVLLSDGQLAVERRNKVLEWMITSIKSEAAMTALQKFAVRSPHDSNTYPSNPFSTDRGEGSITALDNTSMVGAASVFNDLSSRMGLMRV